VIEPLSAVLQKHIDAQGWDTDSIEHVLLQFIANAEDGPDAAARDLDAFLTDLTADEEEVVEATPRERCYAHLEALQGLLTAGHYAPGPAAWIVLEDRLRRTLAQARRAGLLRPGPDAARPAYYVALSIPIAGEMGRLEDADEAAVRAAIEAAPGTTLDGSGAGMGLRDFFAVTTDPGACADALAPLLPVDCQLSLRRLEQRDA
jgi:hypothetical protein